MTIHSTRRHRAWFLPSWKPSPELLSARTEEPGGTGGLTMTAGNPFVRAAIRAFRWHEFVPRRFPQFLSENKNYCPFCFRVVKTNPALPQPAGREKITPKDCY